MPETKTEKSVWEQKKTVYLDRAKGENAVQTELVSVNGRDFYVPRGKDVDVPLPVYNAIMRSREAQNRYDAKCEALARAAKEAALT